MTNNIKRMSKIEKNRPIPRKERPDRAARTKTSFDRLRIDCYEPATVLLLLDSCEETITQRAIVALDKFAVKAPENMNILAELKTHLRMTHLLKSPDIYVRRFSIKLLAQMTTLSQVRQDISEIKNITLNILDFFSEDEDDINNEFSGMILAELTQEATIVDQLLESNIVETVFIRMLSSDPDTQKHSLQILCNLQIDPLAHDLIVNCPNFRFSVLLSHTRSQYPLIQHLTLEVMLLLLKNASDAYLHQLFRKSKGIEVLVEILQMYNWKDLHDVCLSILSLCALAPETSERLHEKNLTPELLVYLTDIQDSKLEEKTLEVLNNVAQFNIGRQILFDAGYIPILLKFLRHEISGLVGAACFGIASLLPYPNALTAISNESLDSDFIKILRSTSRPWKVRARAALAICQLSRYDMKTAIKLVEMGNIDYFLDLFKNPETTLDVKENLLNCINYLLRLPTLRMKLANVALIKTLINCIFKKEDTPEKFLLLGFEALTNALCESPARLAFLQEKAEMVILNYLLIHNVPLRTQVLAAIYNGCKDEFVALGFIHRGAIKFLYEHKNLKNYLPLWDETLEILFRAHLPTKFAFINRLDITDITKEGFYIFRHTPDANLRDVTLSKLLRHCAVPKDIMYVANFSNYQIPPMMKSDDDTETESDKLVEDEVEEEDLDEKIRKAYGCCIPDDGLPEGLKVLKLQLEGKIPRPLEGKTFAACTNVDRTIVLAEFVCAELSGPKEESYTSPPLIDLHVTYLKVELGTSILPIGRLKVGQYLERAMMFKVLADRINLPCAFVRGRYGRAWIEVAIVGEEMRSSINKELHPPYRLLQPNFVVNLMESPGKLMKIGSAEANLYCYAQC